MQRWDYDSHYGMMTGAEDGDFVKYADHQQTVAQLQARVAELGAALAKARDLAKYDQYDLPDAEGGMEQAWRDGYQSAVGDLREALK